MKQEHIVKDGVYVPETDSVWPQKPDEPLLEPAHLRELVVDENYPFIDKSLKYFVWRNFIFAVIWTLVFLLQHVRYGIKFVGLKNLRKNKALFKNGAVTVSNHVYRWDYLAVVQAVKKRLWFPARAENLMGKDEALIRAVGGIPIAQNFSGTKKFYEAFDLLHKKKKWIHVFPESCRWTWYEPIRPFKRGAFEFSHRYDIPVIPIALRYRRPGALRRFFGVKHPLVTVVVGNPILPDMSLSLKKDSMRLLQECHKKIVDMAGIEKNLWPAFLES